MNAVYDVLDSFDSAKGLERNNIYNYSGVNV
jgi:hypothetical protein